MLAPPLRRWLARCGPCTALALTACVVPYATHQVEAQVVDGETGAPLPEATLAIRHHMMLTLNEPPHVGVRTDGDGRATFNLACTPIAQWKVETPGYWPRDQIVRERGFVLPPGIQRTGENSIRIPLWRDPPPRVELVVPDGWQGEFTLELVPCDASAMPIGQRLLVGFVDEQGECRLPAPPILDAWDVWDVWIRERSGNMAVQADQGDATSTGLRVRRVSRSTGPPRRAAFAIEHDARAVAPAD